MPLSISSPLCERPIPLPRSIVGWQQTPIEECGEPLVALKSLSIEKLIVEPRYFARGVEGADSEIYVRSGVGERLGRVAAGLPPECVLLVWDGWRRLVTQKSLFDAQRDVVLATRPGLSDEAVTRLVQDFVSVPSADPLNPSPHLTGGAVDLTLADRNGVPLATGTNFDSFHDHSRTRALEDLLTKAGGWTQSDALAARNRRLLYHSMTAAGFTNFASEWWHFDYGDQFWGASMSRPAFYGPASLLPQNPS